MHSFSNCTSLAFKTFFANLVPISLTRYVFPPISDSLSRLRASADVDRRTEEWEGEPPVNGLVQREMDSGYRVRTQTFFFVLQFCDFRVTKNCSKN